MVAVSRDLTIEQGTTWQHAWQVTIDGQPLDSAKGWQARSQVRMRKTDPVAVHTFTARVVGSVVQLSLQPEESSAWQWRRGVYDVELFDNSTPQRVVRLIEGRITVSPEVTRESM